MINTTGIRTLLLSSALAGALCFGYWKYRGVEERQKELQGTEQSIEQVRNEVRDLQLRLEQTRERVKALEADPVEAEGIARGVGGAVRDKLETVFHVDESHLTPTPAASAPAPEPAPAPAASASAPTPAPATSTPAPAQAPPTAQ